MLKLFPLKRFNSDHHYLIKKVSIVLKVGLWSCRRSFRFIIIINYSWILGLIVRDLTFIVFGLKLSFILLVDSFFLSSIIFIIIARLVFRWLLRSFSLALPRTFRRSMILELSSKLAFIIMHLNFIQLIDHKR